MNGASTGTMSNAARLYRGAAITAMVLSSVWGLYAQLFLVSQVYENGRQARAEIVFRTVLKSKRATPPQEAPQRTESTAAPMDGETPVTQQLVGSLFGDTHVSNPQVPFACDIPAASGIAWPPIAAPPNVLAPAIQPASAAQAHLPYAHGPPASA